MTYPSILLSLPQWMNKFTANYPPVFSSDTQKMDFVIALARENVQQRTGGPFAAAVFNMSTNELIAPGVNVVIESTCSLAHAEMMALGISQKILGTFDLGEGVSRCELVTSTAPCAMCLGAIPWSGVRRVLCGARDEDARLIGFDEGAKVKDWIHQLSLRGIEVIEDVCRDSARDVLSWYRDSGGIIYNSRSGEK